MLFIFDDISFIVAASSSMDAACSVAPCERDCAPADTCCAPEETLSADLLICPKVESKSSLSLSVASLMLTNTPTYSLAALLSTVKSPFANS